MPDKPWIASRLSDGLGNRLFQIANGLRTAEIHKRPYVFFLPRVLPGAHGDCTVLYKLFPQISIVSTAHSWKEVGEAPNTLWKYQPGLQTIIPHEQTVIHGYYQSEKYFPQENPICLDFTNAIPETTRTQLLTTYFPNSQNSDNLKNSENPPTWFLHVRLGDYQYLPHHQIPLQKYLVETLRRVPPTHKILLASDTPTTALHLIPPAYRHQIIPLDPSLDHLQTLYILTQCDGGCIGTNSTFSWWAAYLSKAKQANKPCYFPSPWHNTVPDHPDIYSPWMTVIDTSSL